MKKHLDSAPPKVKRSLQGCPKAIWNIVICSAYYIDEEPLKSLAWYFLQLGGHRWIASDYLGEYYELSCLKPTILKLISAYLPTSTRLQLHIWSFKIARSLPHKTEWRLTSPQDRNPYGVDRLKLSAQELSNYLDLIGNSMREIYPCTRYSVSLQPTREFQPVFRQPLCID